MGYLFSWLIADWLFESLEIDMILNKKLLEILMYPQRKRKKERFNKLLISN
jgi:hypothetical protein